MRTIYSVNHNLRANEYSMYSSSNYNAAKEFYDAQIDTLNKYNIKPIDTSNWTDNDMAWGNVYFLELVKITIDDDIQQDYITNIETINYSDYYEETGL